MKLALLIGLVVSALSGCIMVPYGHGYRDGARYDHGGYYHHDGDRDR